MYVLVVVFLLTGQQRPILYTPTPLDMCQSKADVLNKREWPDKREYRCVLSRKDVE